MTRRGGGRRRPAGKGSGEPPFAPMLATPAGSVPEGEDWVVEPKYDGIRVIAAIDGPAIGLFTRNGKDKVEQFPEVVEALAALGRAREREALEEGARSKSGAPDKDGARSKSGAQVKDGVRSKSSALVMDAEIVAAADTPAQGRFEQLQGRIHLQNAADVARAAGSAPARFVAFDCLLDGDDVLVQRAWRDRRERLERVLARTPRDARDVICASTVARTAEEARKLLAAMKRAGAEGVIAKDAGAPYHPGLRSAAWRKVKLEHQQEFVIGGYTLPREGAAAREDIGALLVGTYDGARLVYAGRVGTGFTRESARLVAKRLAAEHRITSPFATGADSDAELTSLEAMAARGQVRWVNPVLVAEVRFNEWTSAGRLRQPVFLGLRDDKPAKSVRREAPPAARERVVTPLTRRSTGYADVLEQLRRIADAGGNGVLRVPCEREGECPVAVTNLGKPLLPGLGGKEAITKADLMAYYVAIAPVLLPAVRDRPLVLKRMPDGLNGQAFYQQRAPATTPVGMRTELVPNEGGGERRFVGGDLLTLLHLVQLGAISVDPWHGRYRAGDRAVEKVDYSVIDLDPGPDTPFTRVVQVARWVKEELDALGLRAIPKTSGASGIHVVIPLVAETDAESARLLAELVATRVAQKHPREATIVRMVARRPKDAVYVDFLQNIRGKTVAAVYSARAQPGATVSTPLRWSEVNARLDPTRFTIATVPRRVQRTGDLWGEAMREPNDLGELDLG